MNTKETWYVIYTRSRQEKSLSEKLTAAGFQIYLPLIKKESKWTDRTKITEIPLFNSYVFIKGVNDKHLLRDFKGVVRFLSFNNGPAKVSQSEIEILKSIIKYGYDVRETADQASLEIGTKVMIIAGPLKGMIGELIANTEENWFLIYFQNMSNCIQVRIPPGKLKKI